MTGRRVPLRHAKRRIGLLLLVALIGCGGGSGSAKSDNQARDRPTTTSPAVTTTTPLPPAPTLYDGVGDEVLTVRKPGPGPAIVYARYKGRLNFIVQALDSNGEGGDVLVNTIGAYEGTVPLDFFAGDTPQLEVTANGPWHIEIRDIRTALHFDTKFQGRGDKVLIYTGRAGTAAISHVGKRTFVVREVTRSRDRSRTDLNLETIGQYRGSVRWAAGAASVIVQADGDWSISVT